MKNKFIVLLSFLSLLFGSCMSTGSYYVIQESDKESFDVIRNDTLSFGCSIKIISDSLKVYITGKLLKDLNSINYGKLSGVKFKINNMMCTDKSFQKELQYLGYIVKFDEIISTPKLDSILSTGHPVKFIYKIPKEKIEHLNTINVSVQIQMKYNNEIKTYSSKCIMKRRTSYKVFPT